MAERVLTVKILGDSRSLEQAFARSTKATQKLNRQVGSGTGITRELRTQTQGLRALTAAEEDLIKVRSKRASSVGPFRIAGVGLGAGVALVAATQAVRELGVALETTGAAAFTTTGKLKNAGAALTSGNIVGAIKALRATPKVFSDLGISTLQARNNMEAFQQVLKGNTGALHSHLTLLRVTSTEKKRLEQIERDAGVEGKKNAKIVQTQIDLENLRQNVLRGLEFAQRQFNVSIVEGTTAIVAYKGALDDLPGPRGPGARAFETPFQREGRETLPSLSPSQRRELDLIGKEDIARISGLKDRLRQLNNQMKNFHGNQEQRLTILTNIKNTEAEIAAIYKDQAAARAADGVRAQAAAEAAARELAAKLKAAKAARLEAIENARERRNAKQFFALGLSPTGGERTPNIQGLQRQLGNFEDAVKGSFLDTKKTRSLMTTIRGILAKGMKGVSEEVRAVIRDMLRDLNQQLKTAEEGPRTLAKLLDVSSALQGLTGSPAALARARNMLTGATFVPRAGGVAAVPLGAVAGRQGLVINGPVYITANNTDEIQRELEKKKRRGSQGRR